LGSGTILRLRTELDYKRGEPFGGIFFILIKKNNTLFLFNLTAENTKGGRKPPYSEFRVGNIDTIGVEQCELKKDSFALPILPILTEDQKSRLGLKEMPDIVQELPTLASGYVFGGYNYGALDIMLGGLTATKKREAPVSGHISFPSIFQPA